MFYSDDVKKAMKLCFEAHKNQVDKGGMPYAFHPIHLAEHIGGYDSNYAVTALLHDVVEDSDFTLDDLRQMGFDEGVIKAIDALTRKNGEDYFDYIARIKENKIARTVKIADLRHNSDVQRIGELTNEDYERLGKYRKALDILDHKGQFIRGDIETRRKKNERLFGSGDYENEKIDIRELSFLDAVRDCPAVYLGRKNLTALSHELSGIRTGIYICEHICHTALQSKLNDFAAKKYDDNRTLDWCGIILEHTNCEEDAFDEFYKMLDEFLEQEGIVIE